LGFGGGGGGTITNHVHDLTPLQGGPLDFNNTTVGGMSAGDITFSDGAALQTLTYPAVPAGETLTAAALSTAPSWLAAPGATPTWTTLADETITGVAASLDSGVFAAHDVLAIYIFAALNTADGQGIIFNADSGANQYCFRDLRNGVMFTTSNYPCIQFGFGATTNWMNSAWTITQRDATEKIINGFSSEQTGTLSTSIPSQALVSGMYRDAINPITQVTCSSSTGGAVPFAVGSRLIVLGSA